MDFASEAAIAKELLTFLEKGSVYKGVRPIMWSPIEKTALADAEMEYQDKKSPAIYVAFKIKRASLPVLENARVVIWTTTPWTIPGNRAVAYGDDIDYVALAVNEVAEMIVWPLCGTRTASIHSSRGSDFEGSFQNNLRRTAASCTPLCSFMYFASHSCFCTRVGLVCTQHIEPYALHQFVYDF